MKEVQKSEGRTACDKLIKLLNKKPNMDFSFNLFIFYQNTFTKEILNLMRAKLACEQGMLVSNKSTVFHTVYTTPKGYEDEMEIERMQKNKNT